MVGGWGRWAGLGFEDGVAPLSGLLSRDRRSDASCAYLGGGEGEV